MLLFAIDAMTLKSHLFYFFYFDPISFFAFEAIFTLRYEFCIGLGLAGITCRFVQPCLCMASWQIACKSLLKRSA